jgi:transcriptional regulator with XRE-family HTH domain
MSAGDSLFTRRLREFRLLAGMTQQHLADQMARTGSKIHRSTVGKIEIGDRPVTIGEAVQFAAVLGVPLAELVADPSAGTGHARALIEAQLTAASIRREAEEQARLVREAKALYENAAERLNAAERHLAELQ